jgi:hypothetical protein
MKKALKWVGYSICAISFGLCVASYMSAQSITEIFGSGITFRSYNPVIKADGSLTIEDLAGTDLKVFDSSGNEVATGDITAGDDFLLGAAGSTFGGFAASVTPTEDSRIFSFPEIASTIVTPGDTTAISNQGYIKIAIGGADFLIPVFEDE